MPQTTIIKSLDDKTARGEITITALTKARRLQGALKISGVLFGLAVVSVFIPVLHFVLVPGFLIASAIAFFVTFTVKNQITAHSTTCPNCSQALSLKGQDVKFPMRLVCGNCQATSYLDLAE